MIRVACDTKDSIDWRMIKPLQGNYKNRTEKQIEKLRNLIVKRGIRFPSFVARIEGDVWAIDTHGRLLAYERLENEGYAIPPIPVVYVHAKDKNEAKQLLLECDSRYGSVSQSGFDEFVEDFEISAFIDEADMNEFYEGLEIPGIEACGQAEPNDLDNISEKSKALYVKVNCENTDQVKHIVSVLERNDIDKKQITISA